jgi:hypothetical protein
MLLRLFYLTSEAVESTALSLQSVYNIHGSDGLPLSMLGVGDGITDNIFQEYFKHTTSLFINETRNTLDATTTSQPTNGGLGDTLDVIS